MSIVRKILRVICNPHLRKQVASNPVAFGRRVYRERTARRIGGWKEVANQLRLTHELVHEKNPANSSVCLTSQQLKLALDQNGSDKAKNHNYHVAYGVILDSLFERFSQVGIVEIGVGTTDPSHPSSMGLAGTPGASLRAWETISQIGSVVGGDNSEVALSACGDLRVDYVDQRSTESLNSFLTRWHNQDLFTMLIDDGLHAPDANWNTVRAGVEQLGLEQSLLIVEDAADDDLNYWALALQFCPGSFLIVRFNEQHHRSKLRLTSRFADMLSDKRHNLVLVSSAAVIQRLRIALMAGDFVPTSQA